VLIACLFASDKISLLKVAKMNQPIACLLAAVAQLMYLIVRLNDMIAHLGVE
jgi:hypothetical protein